uniref:Poly-gamma-glutamate biosynthesis protein PgsC n=1 Tax=candidate division WOR-3 bacterium TaxID=2052148 RepID=A0A7C6A8I5_UNCW3
MIIEGIGIGMLMSFFLTETIGLAAGGIVVPGYIALLLHHPLKVIMTILVALATYLLTKFLSNFILLYGRRLLVLAVLIGYLLGYVTRLFPPLVISQVKFDIATIGYVIPGLVAYWMNRQGVIETITTMVIAAALTRFLVIVISGGVLLP